MDSISLNTMNNKFPCDGPRAVPLPLDFSNQSSYSIDLTNLVQRGAISDIQGFFVDNSNNGNPLTIVVAIQQQTIIVPANSQGYITALLGDPIFTATTIPAANLMVRMFALNFPVSNQIWPVEFGGGGGSSVVSVSNFPALQNVNVADIGSASLTLGNKTMAASIPVTIASDQGAYSNAALRSAGWLDVGVPKTLAVTTISASVAINSTVSESVRVFNYGAETAFVVMTTIGGATLSNTAIAPNTSFTFAGGVGTSVSAICATVGTSLQISVGTGLPQ